MTLRETDRSFLEHLYERTRDDPATRVSMYDIGREAGLDKNASKQVSEELIAHGFVEIRTLAGGIGITTEGIDEVTTSGAGAGGFDPGAVTLGDQPVLDENARQAVDALIAGLKPRIGNLGLAFDPLGELLADFRTVDAQLMSPHPKTAIIKACFNSILNTLKRAGEQESVAGIQRLLG